MQEVVGNVYVAPLYIRGLHFYKWTHGHLRSQKTYGYMGVKNRQEQEIVTVSFHWNLTLILEVGLIIFLEHLCHSIGTEKSLRN